MAAAVASPIAMPAVCAPSKGASADSRWAIRPICATSPSAMPAARLRKARSRRRLGTRSGTPGRACRCRDGFAIGMLAQALRGRGEYQRDSRDQRHHDQSDPSAAGKAGLGDQEDPQGREQHAAQAGAVVRHAQRGRTPAREPRRDQRVDGRRTQRHPPLPLTSAAPYSCHGACACDQPHTPSASSTAPVAWSPARRRADRCGAGWPPPPRR